MKINLAIFFGGKSAEHEISVLSAKSVFENVNKEKYNISLFGFNKSGEVFKFDDVSIKEDVNTMFKEERKVSFADFTEILVSKIDVVFPILHGPIGEDGKIQGFMEFLDVAYVGCGVATSSACMDKALTKDVLLANKFRVAPSTIVHIEDYKRDPKGEIERATAVTGYPLFIKPCNMGSSVGISKVKDRDEFRQAIKIAFEYDDHVIVEKGINAKELECGILGNYGAYQATEVGEVLPSHEFYDYEAKYSEDALSDIRIPAEIDSATREYIQKETIRAAKVFGVSGLSRCDFLVDKESGDIYLSEINTMPGYTKFSMYPQLCGEIGYTYSQLIDKLIELALEKRGV